MLLEKAIRHHLEALVAEGRSRHTVRNARSVLSEMTSFLAPLDVRDTGEMSLDALMCFRQHICSRLTAKGMPLAPGSQREHIGKLRTFCRWLFEQDWLTVDLAKRIPKPRRTRRLPKPIMDVGEVDRILACPDLATRRGTGTA